VALSSRRRSRRSWPQRLLIAFNIFLVMACLATAGTLTLVRQKLSKVQVVSLGVSLAPQVSADEPRNILIIGTDSAARLDPKDPVRRQRPQGEDLADVIMVMRLDPKTNTASLLSIPRDSWLPIAPFGTKAKINSAIAGPNGPQNLIETIKENFAISIDNYVEIDFEGFRGLVQALGYVPVYLT
jgi:anionic cell wall polymer biosynthesis LytR-Cps2A-Psr (LCP) family protein